VNYCCRAKKTIQLIIRLSLEYKTGHIKFIEDYLSYLNQTNTVNTIEKKTSAAKVSPKKDKELSNINNDLSLKRRNVFSSLQKKEETLLNGASIDAKGY
jgi:hypothetical protein